MTMNHHHEDRPPGAGPAPGSGESRPETRAGYVTLAGRPNAGKSTLLNALVGQKLSIVTSKAQTTWKRVTGIHTSDRSQMIFLDTPGLLDVEDLLQRSMLGAARTAIAEADVVLPVIDAAGVPDARQWDPVCSALEGSTAPRVVALNKVDVADPERVEAHAVRAADVGGRVHRVSALTGEGVAGLRSSLEEALPAGPFLYPADDIATEPVRFFAAELIRETAFEQFREEVPYSTFAVIEEFREGQDPVYIGATVYVERESQKRILIGRKGSAVKALGREARERIEHFIGRSVYLDLWIKVMAGWRRKRDHLRRLGFHVPEDDDAEER